MRLDVDGVSVAIGSAAILDGADLCVEHGQFVALVGPNGCGKSTLLRTIYRALRPAAGTVFLDERDVWRMSARESARRTAVVAQEHHADFDFTVREVVLLGRIPHKRPFDRDCPADVRLTAWTLDRVGMTGFGDRAFATLSGGEKQRVLVARALAQESPLFLLDEPTNHLDIRYQIETMELIKGLKVTTLAALHDLNLAAQYCDRVHVMRAGRIVADGPPGDVLTSELIEAVFGVRAERMTNPATGRLHLAFSPAPAAVVVQEVVPRSRRPRRETM